MSNVFQFLETRRTGPDKKPGFVHIKGFVEPGDEHRPQPASEDIFDPR